MYIYIFVLLRNESLKLTAHCVNVVRYATIVTTVTLPQDDLAHRRTLQACLRSRQERGQCDRSPVHPRLR